MKIFYIILFIVSASLVSLGQDIHFSQFFNTPLPVNPALTGFMKQDIRLNAIYRNQWRQANATFSTVAFGADVNLLPPVLKGDKIGVGILVFRDQMGSETFTNNSVYGSLSYIKTLDPQKRHKLSIGTQFGIVQKRVDYSSLYFGNQIVDYRLDPGISSGENGIHQSFSYFNLNAGLFYRFRLAPGTDLHAGVSFFNLLRPKENFAVSVEDDLNKLKNRGLIQIGGRQKIINRLYFRPEIMFMTQTRARNIDMGAMLEYCLTDNPDLIVVQAGLWTRVQDALILYGGLKYHNIHIGISYDATQSSLLDIRNSPEVKDRARIGAFEIVLTYYGFLKRALPYQHTVPCKFF